VTLHAKGGDRYGEWHLRSVITLNAIDAECHLRRVSFTLIVNLREGSWPYTLVFGLGFK